VPISELEIPPGRQQLKTQLPRKTKIFLEWTAAILFSLGLAVTIAEFVLRYASITIPAIHNGVYFSEHPERFRDQHNKFGYEPLSKIREGAVYSDYKDAWVEYDVSFSVNNAGLVQQKHIDPSQKYTVGDSFMHGLGASPWFYDLERDLPLRPLANLGVAGSGVVHWAKAINWFQRSLAQIEKVGIILITDDFFRPYWIAKATEDEIAFCYEQRCDRVFVKYHDGPPRTLIQEWYERPTPGPSNSERMKEKYKEELRAIVVKLRFGQLLINLKRSLLSSREKRFIQLNKRGFEEIIKLHKVAFTLHIPEKAEASARQWSQESRKVRTLVEKTGVHYIDGMEKCQLGNNDFHRFDDHPNSVGYMKIRQCVADLLTN
jgi:hypothetical protein